MFCAELRYFDCGVANIHNLLCDTLHFIAKNKGIDLEKLSPEEISKLLSDKELDLSEIDFADEW